MTHLALLFIIMAGFWTVGSAIAVGLLISLRDKSTPRSRQLYLWALFFSWAFVGWMAGELVALLLQTMSTICTSVSSIAKGDK